MPATIKPLAVFALVTRGLESVAAQEMAALPGVVVVETAYRRVAAQVTSGLTPLLGLRTPDDLYLDLATWNDVQHTRAALTSIEAWSAVLDLTAAVRACAALRPIRSQPWFSVTASFVGKRNYNSEAIKTAVSRGILSRHPAWTYTLDDREADLNLRIFIEHEIAYVGLRLGTSPLHERGYKLIQRPGSLKPPVAAAMLHLVGLQSGHRLLDPCCGAGTILIEGAAMGAQAIGGDIDSEAVAAAFANARVAQATIDVCGWDARALPLPDGSLDRLVTNLPWGRQITVDDRLEAFYRDVCAQIERILAPGGRAAILTSTPGLLRFNRLQPEQALEISLFGQTPTIALYSATR